MTKSIASTPTTTTERTIDSRLLLEKQSRIVILHQGQRYLLSETKAGKLILTK